MTSSSFRALAAALLALAGCATPPAEPAPPPAPPRPSAARQVIDAQLAARPSGPQTAMNGDEATVIYQNYLKQIGRPERGSSRPGASAGGQMAGASVP